MDWDDLAEQHSQHFFASWLKILLREMPSLPIRLAGKHRQGKRPVEASDPITGSFNICVFVTFEDGYKVVVRFPIMGRSRFRVEKTNNELLTMGYLSRRIQVPLPEILGTGMWECGPYIVTAWVDGIPLSTCFQDLNAASSTDLACAYRGMAVTLLELYKLPFPRIGAISFTPGAWKIGKRPLTLAMNEFVRVGNLPPDCFAKDSFQTGSEYFQEVANQHFLHLKYQRNNAVLDEDDCRKKYVARCLFRKITREIRTQGGPFRLYCDDFRPSNVLVASETDLTVKAVIDWEFTYAAPVEYSHAAPWWLLFESPEAWESDLHEFLNRYKPRLEIFLGVMRECEAEWIRDGRMDESGRLSERMSQSLDNGVFWLCLAARRSSMFDDVYWTFLDQMFFGPFTSLEDRLLLLSDLEREQLDDFVKEKLQQKQECTLDEHLTIDEVMDL